MKKSLIVSALLFAAMAFSASAQDSKKEQEYKYPFQEAKITYHNVTVYKVLDHKDAYLVMYGKGHGSVGSVSIPKNGMRKTRTTTPSSRSARSRREWLLG